MVFLEDWYFPKMISSTCQGLSVYSLLEPLVASTGGQKQLRRWLRQPSRWAASPVSAAQGETQIWPPGPEVLGHC